MSGRLHSRRVGVIFMLSIAPLTGFAPRAIAQQDMSDVEITATYVAGNVYMLQGRGGNIGVSVGPDGALLVDDQFAPLADKIRAALAGMVEGEIDLKFVLNTHWHGDHTGGNIAFGPEAPIIAHANVRERLATRQERALGVIEPSPPKALPVITFGDSVSIHFNGEEIRAIHLPHGHTDGDAVVYFSGSNVVHMGDDFFSGRFPFVDLSSGGSVQGLVVAVRGVLERLPPDVKIIPGHGPLSGREDLEAYLEMVEESLALVSVGIEAGKSLKELQAAGMPDQWADWGGGFINSDRWIEILYRSLQGS
jgi:glyoxylase-like metal-dependent hydrolase (beta-lactamase superfamily II)